MSPHRPATWAGICSRPGPPVSQCVSPLNNYIKRTRHRLKLNRGRGSIREEVFMEGPIEPNMGPSLADVLLCSLDSTDAGFSSFPVRKLLS